LLVGTDAVHPPAALLEPLDASLDGRKHQGVVTRCPPEPNGYLHLGHAKSVAKSG
jgi:glutaminyl-tRNA synthetase